ncbi:MAG: hypothetical protein ACRYGI_05285 [Janthinobacterium lividum]
MNTARRLLLVAACVTTLSGCGSKKDPNKSNFSEAIKASLAKDADVCLTEPGQAWPVDVRDGDIAMSQAMGAGTPVQMEALRTVGLVGEQSAVVSVKALFGPMIQQVGVHRYTLTEKGKSYIKNVKSSNLFDTSTALQPAICVGKKTLHEVQKWDGPMRLGDYAEATVYYSFEVDDLPNWAKIPSLQKAFPVLQQIGSGSPVNTQAVLKLTSNGWEVKGLE